MPYWIHGRDSKTGGLADPFFNDSDDESAARLEAEVKGVRVESVECHIEETQLPDQPQHEQREDSNPFPA